MQAVKVVALVCALALGAAACGSSSDDAAHNRRWSKRFCTSLATWQRSTTSTSADRDYQQTPAPDPNAVKAKLAAYLRRATGATDKLTREIDRAGTPAIANGRQAVDSLKAGSRAVRKVLAGAEAAVTALPVDDTTRFTAGIQSANATLGAGFNQFGAALDRVNRLDTDKKLVAAEKSVPACRSLLS